MDGSTIAETRARTGISQVIILRVTGLTMLIGSMTLAGIWFWSATTRGLGLSGDSVDYVVTTRNLSHGNGLVTLDGKRKLTPLTQFPPAYPTALAIYRFVDARDVLSRARTMHLVLDLASILLAAVLAKRLTGSDCAAGVASMLLAVSQPPLAAATMLLSEILYIALVLLTLVLLSASLSTRRYFLGSALAGIAVALAILTRYAGSLLGVVAIVSILCWSSHPIRVRIWCCFVLGICAAIPPMLWSWRNILMTGQPTSRVAGFHPPTTPELLDGLQTLATPLVSRDLPASAFIGGAILVGMIACIVVTTAALRRGARDDLVRRATLLACTTFLVLHPLFLVLSRTIFDANIRLRDRLLSPAFPVFVVLLVTSVAVMTCKWRHRTSIACLLAIAIGLPLGSRTSQWVNHTSQIGQGYASKNWNKSATLQLVKSARPGMVIYSNAYDAIYLRAGRKTYQLPKARLQVQDRENPRLGSQIDQMVQRLQEDDGWIVYFNLVRRDDFMVGESEIEQRADLIPVFDPQPADGRIYRVAPSFAGQ